MVSFATKASLEKGGHHVVPVGQLAQFHGTVGTAREEAAVGVRHQVRDAHADVAKQRASRVLVGEGVQQPVHGQAPDLCESWTRFKQCIPRRLTSSCHL